MNQVTLVIYGLLFSMQMHLKHLWKPSLFDKANAESFRKNILAKGGSEDPMELYTKFRGRKPTVDALLKNRGLD
jgi:Zn-dependent oligopeptidase